ncbi:uncharacterized protein A1O9_00660 [Exophiala aquamarina CBS 119918]|uniref:Uncharacterized protein n=1 Tax=Exophiala aquamarina CBS 119918 TaxID=1182545 RepID=A0A072PSE8_9EURO|nr:uncharacterized protein A1O9_00660 [Exophiala aquamarina CBS 119918]KEF62687.1 hypothetical protein A1O9_00660 [Exophiala aquamarina CBS 119918]
MLLLRRTSLIALSLGVFTFVLFIQQLGLNPFGAGAYYGQKGPLYNPSVFSPGVAKPAGENYSRILVMGRLGSEDISWVARELPDLQTKIYNVDDVPRKSNGTSPGSSGLPANKGHEAMAYLTYIIDHYSSLPDVVLFFHPHHNAWHNNILLDIDSAKTIKLMSSAHVTRQGYFNSRCHLDPGCPDWLHVDRPKWRWDLIHKPEEPKLTSQLFHDLHGTDTPIPAAISQPCCAQFAVSRDRIIQRPRDFYVRYRDWILSTELDDKDSGRLLEYSWQYIFTGNFEFCPIMHRCYCDGYGICFEGDAGVDRWLDVLRQREKVDRKRVDLWDKGRKGSEKYKQLDAQSHQLTEKMDWMREQALRRGADPKIRAMECGREWKEGDGY